MARRSKHEPSLAPATPPGAVASRRIVSAARRHFFTHGFRNVTMDDLAEELGMSKKTLYVCFPSKTHLVRAVLLDKFNAVDGDLGRIMARGSGDVLQALHRLLACMRQHTEEIQPPFVRDIRREAPEMFELVQQLRRRLIERYFGGLFEQGRRTGIIRKDISSRLMIEILLGATESIVNPAKLAELGLTVKHGYLAVINVILEGVLATQHRSPKVRARG
jgi:AcrR family transcriptional regulator